MVKQLTDICLGCIAQNLHLISNVGKHLPTRHKEKLLQWVVDHNMLTADYLPHVTYHLFSPALRSVSFCNCAQISDKLLVQLDACQCRLERITIDGCKITDVGVSALLSHQMGLQSLVLKELSEVTGTGLEVLKSANLEEVDLTQCINVTNKSVATLVTKNPSISKLVLTSCYKLTNEVIPTITEALADTLEHLDLSSIHTIEDTDLVTLAENCKNLKGLLLHGCNRITSAGLIPFSKACTKLQILDVSFCYKLQESSSRDFLTELPTSLKTLVLSGLQLEGGDIVAAVSRLPKLETLRLCGMNSLTEDDADEIFKAVGAQLTCLDMTGCHQILTDQILKAIVKNCTLLEELSLAFCMKITGEPLRALFKNRKRAGYLTTISLSGCKEFSYDVLVDMSSSCCNMRHLFMSGIKCVDDQLLFSLANNMTQLQNISLKSCIGANADQVTDNGVVELTRYCPLEDISLAGVRSITDKSVFALANNCPDLKTLFVSGCSKITSQATNYLQDVCNYKVYVYHRLPNADPNLVMAKNLDTGEFCRVDQTAWNMLSH